MWTPNSLDSLVKLIENSWIVQTMSTIYFCHQMPFSEWSLHSDYLRFFLQETKCSWGCMWLQWLLMDLNSQVTRRERGPNDIINKNILQKTAFMKPVICLLVCFYFSRQGFSVVLEPVCSSLYRTGYPQTLRHLPVSQVVGLKVCATTTQLW